MTTEIVKRRKRANAHLEASQEDHVSNNNRDKGGKQSVKEARSVHLRGQ
jgi:hypothetical protein